MDWLAIPEAGEPKGVGLAEEGIAVFLAGEGEGFEFVLFFIFSKY